MLGEAVRYDGGHKNNRYLSAVLQEYFELVPICPEVGIGMSIPRPPIRLQGSEAEVRVLGVSDPSLDVTDELTAYADSKLDSLLEFSGYIFKKDSPSCGMERVKRYQGNNVPPVRDGVGAYAKQVMKCVPLLPVEEEGRLQDPVLRENFIERVFVYQAWQKMVSGKVAPSQISNFHADHKYALMAHDQDALRELGRIAANRDKLSLDQVLERYGALLMRTFKKRATRKNHTNVLQHLMGYLKNEIDPQDKQVLTRRIDEYRQGTLPLLVPITLLKYFFEKHQHDYIARQTYLNPHPPELMLRNQL